MIATDDYMDLHYEDLQAMTMEELVDTMIYMEQVLKALADYDDSLAVRVDKDEKDWTTYPKEDLIKAVRKNSPPANYCQLCCEDATESKRRLGSIRVVILLR